MDFSNHPRIIDSYNDEMEILSKHQMLDCRERIREINWFLNRPNNIISKYCSHHEERGEHSLQTLVK